MQEKLWLKYVARVTQNFMTYTEGPTMMGMNIQKRKIDHNRKNGTILRGTVRYFLSFPKVTVYFFIEETKQLDETDCLWKPCTRNKFTCCGDRLSEKNIQHFPRTACPRDSIKWNKSSREGYSLSGESTEVENVQLIRRQLV